MLEPASRDLTIKELRRKGFFALKEVQSNDDIRSLEADLILLSALKIEGAGREYLFSNSLESVSADVSVIFLDLLARRSVGEPLAYILNRKEFFGRDFYVDHRVLIPRPETETLVEKALAFIIEQNQKINLIDIGTGSGCIMTSLLGELVNRNLSSLVNIKVASDLSEDALRVAKINTSRLLPMDQIPRFIKADLFSNELVTEVNSEHPLIILANLPYIEVEDQEICKFVRQFEPNRALFSEEGGLQHVFRLLAQVASTHKTLEFKDKSIKLYLEIGYKQANRVQFEASKNGFKSVILHSDLAGKDRIIECHL